jgi:uncharacterized membrane protein YjfL (UPF0719 family)
MSFLKLFKILDKITLKSNFFRKIELKIVIKGSCSLVKNSIWVGVKLIFKFLRFFIFNQIQKRQINSRINERYEMIVTSFELNYFKNI